jgi:lysophospholipase L1-like esterase
MKSLKKWLLRFCILSGSVALVFIIGEIFIRLIVPPRNTTTIFQKLPDSPRLIGLIPYYEGIRKGVPVKINSKGFRDLEFNPAKEKNVFRIIGLGDSVTYGAGVRLEDTYLKQLERMLNGRSSGKQYQILNMGVPAYNTYQELIFLKEVGLAYYPDMVVVGFTVNDVDLLNTEWLMNRELTDPTQFNDAVLQHKETRAKKIYGYIKSKSEFIFFLSFRMSALMRKLNIPIETEATRHQHAFNDNNKGWLLAKDSLKEIKILGEQNGYQLLVVIIPYLTTLDDSFHWIDAHAAIKAYCESQQIPVLDLFPYYKGQETRKLHISITDNHPNAKAHNIAARAIIEWFEGTGCIDLN